MFVLIFDTWASVFEDYRGIQFLVRFGREFQHGVIGERMGRLATRM